jgi:glycosyltransferase involved in cell wall biosynthesis
LPWGARQTAGILRRSARGGTGARQRFTGGSATETGFAPGVSFLITVYNKREYLPAVIAGLERQGGGFAREFIFIDDGSSDGSAAEIRRLAGNLDNVRLIAQANRGPSLATNRGLALARFPLVKLVDGDDVLLPDATAALRDALLRHPEAVLAFGGGEGYDTAARATARLACAAGGGDPGASVIDALPALLRNCFLSPSLCLLRADPARAVGGCDERVFTQDYSLFLRLAARGTFVRVAATIALAPERAAGRVNDGGPQVLHDINLSLAHFLAEHALPAAVARRAVRRALRRAWHWARRREGGLARAAAARLLAAAYLRRAAAGPGLLRRSCAIFAAGQPVRRTAPPSAAPPSSCGR